MHVDSLRLRASIADELLGHLRGRRRLFRAAPWTEAIFDTTFDGCYRVEIEHRPVCRVAVEHVGGDGAFEWSMAEEERRRPGAATMIDGPIRPPTPDDVPYRVEVFDADPDRGQELLRTLLALDWGEPTPEDPTGRDGVVLSGAVTTDAGVRVWTTWSPEPAREPAKSAFFQHVLRFAVDHAAGGLGRELGRVEL